MTMGFSGIGFPGLVSWALLYFVASTGDCAFSNITDDQATTLDPTILLLGSYDFLPYHSTLPYSSRCTDMIKRSAELRTNRLQFVPTLYWRSSGSTGEIGDYCWVDSENVCRPFTECTQVAVDLFRKGMQLCFESAIEMGFTSLTVTPHLDNRDTQEGWTIRAWRNGLVFDPRAKYGGWSYEEIMLEPLALALAPLLSGTGKGCLERLDFGLQGEMGASVMRYPHQYSALRKAVHSKLLGMENKGSGASTSGHQAPASSEDPSSASTNQRVPQLFPDARGWANLLGLWDDGVERTGGIPFPFLTMQPTPQQLPNAASSGELARAGSKNVESEEKVVTEVDEATAGQLSEAMQQNANSAPDDRVRFGLSFNFIYADGSQRYTTSLLGQIGVAFVGSWFGFRPGFGAPLLDPPAVEALLYEMDFIGISAYHPLTSSFTTNELQNSIFNVVDGFSSIGIDLDAVLHAPRLNGGGHKEIHYVEFGVGGGASQSGSGQASSPQQVLNTPYWGVQGPYRAATDPWSNKHMRDFLHSFYARVLDWLMQGTGPTYKVSACFLWNHGSFDIFGIHPESTTREGTYRDDTLVDAIAFHNERTLNS